MELQEHELQRPPLKPEFGEHYGLEGVQGNNYGHAPDILGMRLIAHSPRNRAQKDQNHSHEQQGHSADHL